MLPGSAILPSTLNPRFGKVPSLTKPLLIALAGLMALAGVAHASKPAIVSPVPNSFLPPSASISFQWSNGGRADINAFYLYAGGSIGARNYAAKPIAAGVTSATLTIPAPAVSVYVRLWFRVGTTWDYSDFAYRRTPHPVGHRELPGATATFEWPAGGISYWVWIGSRPQWRDMHTSGALPAPRWTVHNLPTDGRLVYVRLWTQLANGRWIFTDSVYATHAEEAEEEDSNDGDLDADGVRDEFDPDIDGDGIANASDTDIDGDGLVNASDDDDDGDGILDNEDAEPNGPTPDTHHEISVRYFILRDSEIELRHTGDAFVWSTNRAGQSRAALMLRKGQRYYVSLDAGEDSGAIAAVILNNGPWVLAEHGTNVPTNRLSVREFERKELNLLPVSVVELAPKVMDNSNPPKAIEGSENPNVGRPLTPFVKINPYTDKIAHRELKVSFDEALNGKVVTWSLLRLPGATPANIRGQWSQARLPDNRNRFEPSTTYGGHGFHRANQFVGQTTIATGITAIRVNIPPIGLNQARIRIHVEGAPAHRVIDLIDMEVPAVVMIDPGHGAHDAGAIARTDPSILEKDLAWAYATELRDDVARKFKDEKRGLRLLMTRKVDEGPSPERRARMARDEGADVFLSIHFNDHHTDARGTETWVNNPESWQEHNLDEDRRLATAINGSTLSAVKASDANAKDRGIKESTSERGLIVLRDGPTYNGNTAAFKPVKACLVEVEFLSNRDALNSVKLSTESGVAIKNAFGQSVAQDIFNHILTQP